MDRNKLQMMKLKTLETLTKQVEGSHGLGFDQKIFQLFDVLIALSCGKQCRCFEAR